MYIAYVLFMLILFTEVILSHGLAEGEDRAVDPPTLSVSHYQNKELWLLSLCRQVPAVGLAEHVQARH